MNHSDSLSFSFLFSLHWPFSNLLHYTHIKYIFSVLSKIIKMEKSLFFNFSSYSSVSCMNVANLGEFFLLLNPLYMIFFRFLLLMLCVFIYSTNTIVNFLTGFVAFCEEK
jgi:hypothetical protein